MTSLRKLHLLIAISFTFMSLQSTLASSVSFLPQKSNNLEVSVINTDASGASLSASINNSPVNTDLEAEPYSSGMLWALPSGTISVAVEITSTQWRNINDNEVADSVRAAVLTSSLPLVTVSPVMIMRGVSLTTVAINALQPRTDAYGLRICEQVDFHLNYVSGIPDFNQRLVSYSFWDILHGVAGNLDDVSTQPERRPEPYLIITRPAYVTTLNSFINWKRQRGHSVTVATTDQTGTANTQIKAYLQNAYDTWDEPPVFVLLVGDVDGANSMPGWEIPGYYHSPIISDHRYALLEGTDYLPDVLIGRFSVDGTTDLLTVINKCLLYESNPYQHNGTWRTQMLITGVKSSPSEFETYNSAWPTLQWIRGQFLASGYSQVDSVPFPPGSASQINNSINDGVSFVAYRGFGSPEDWAYPHYTVNNIEQLANGEMMPVITSIVCGGGAFDDTDTDPCFGEKWLRLGTPANPRGAIGFIGPSELDTKTRWNNTNIAGIYEGILHENVNTLSAAMLRGKMELMYEFPNNVNNYEANSDRSVSFYFDTYNLLGDPGLNFFVGAVRDLSASVPQTVLLGTPTLSLQTTENGNPLSEVWGTVKRNDEIVGHALSNSAGQILLSLPQDVAGNLIITLTKPRHEPIIDTIALTPTGSLVTSSSVLLLDNGTAGSIGNGDGILNPGERIALSASIHNYGTTAYSGGQLSLESTDGNFAIVNGSATVPSLAAGASTQVSGLLVDVGRNVVDQTSARLNWTITPGSYTWTTAYDVRSPVLSVNRVRSNGDTLNPEPNSAVSLSLDLSNIGSVGLDAATVTLHTADSRITLIDSTSTYPAIPAGSIGSPLSSFEIQVGNFYPGDWAAIELIVANGSVNSTINYLLPIGNLEPTDPTHPDGYGYRAFQDADAGYIETPIYAWIEIDPTRGGSGTNLAIADIGAGYDATVTTTLPFAFHFYGVTYNQISICSNGFVSLGQTPESFFRNYSLPAIASPNNMICAFWDDLSMQSDSRICTYHDVTGGRFIIEWSHMHNEYGAGLEETFEIILFNTNCWPTQTGDGDILIQYQTINNVDVWDNYSTVGIQNCNLGYALQLSYAGQMSPGVATIRSQQAILITTGRATDTAFLNYAGNLIDDDNEGGSQGNGDGVPQNGETVQIQIRLQNIGALSAPAATGQLVTSDPLVNLLDSQISFPAIPPGSTVTGSFVRAVLSPSTPNGHVTNFTLSLTGGALPCIVLPSLTTSGPLLSLLPLTLNDDSIPPSIGNNNNEINPGETIELTPGATNTGGNYASNVTAILRRVTTNVTLLDSTAALGTINQNSQSTATDPFLVRVSQNALNGQQIQFNVLLRDQYGTQWSQPVSFVVVEPHISSAGIRIADPAPGGNGNERLEPGETGELYPRVANVGLGSASNIVVTLSTNDPNITLQNTTVQIGTVSGNSTREATIPVNISVTQGSQSPRSAELSFDIVGDNGISIHNSVYLLIGDAIFFSDFEGSTPANWAVFGTQGLWHVQTRQCASPAQAFYCGLETSVHYPPLADAYLRSPSFNYSGVGTLIFSTKYNTYNTSDVCRVQLQCGSSTYYLLDQFSGDGSAWHQRQYSLSGHPAANEAYIRFWFNSNASGEAEGWYVDDVILLDQEQAIDNTSDSNLPSEFALQQNYPNPFNGVTTIQYSVPSTSRVQIALYDITGRQVALLVDAQKAPGKYRLNWQPLSLASGIYFVHLKAGGADLTHKLIYLK